MDVSKILDKNLPALGKMSGRYIKNLLRLTCRRGISKPSVEDLLHTAKFLPPV